MTAKKQILYLGPDSGGRYSIRLDRPSVAAVKELLEARITEMVRATELVRSELVRVPSEVDIKLGGAKEKILAELVGTKELFNAELRIIDERFKKIDAIHCEQAKALHAAYTAHKDFGDARAKFVDEKFRSIETQFEERDIRVDENKTTSAKGVADAFAAAEKVGQEQTRNFKEVIEKSEAANAKVVDQIQKLLQEIQKSLDDKINALDLRVTRAEGSRSGIVTLSAIVFSFISLLIAIFVALKR